MDPFGVAVSVIQVINFAGRMIQKVELRNCDAKDTEFVQSLQSWSGRVGDLTGLLESFGKQHQTDKIRESRELIRYQYSLDVEMWGIQKGKRTDQGEGSQEIPSAASLRDLAELSKKTLQDLANWFDRLQEGKGTEKAKAPEWQGRLQGLRKQWETAVEQLPWSVLVDKRDSYMEKWTEAHREPAEALYESRNSGISGEERQKPIAVVGMACRLPEQASSLFWQMLIGKQSASPIPSVRWVAQRREPSAYLFNEDLGQFDAPFFNRNPREASQTDPQQRLLLETAHEAIENAGHAHNRSSQTPPDRRARCSCTFGCGYTSRRCFDWKEMFKNNRKYHFLPVDQEGKQSILSGDTMRTYQSPVNPVYQFLFSTASALTGAVCAICMCNYDRLHPRGRLFTQKRHIIPQLSRLSSIIFSPSPPIFVAATLIHGIATLSYYHSRPGDRYKEWFLTAGIIGGTITGFWVGADMQSMLLVFLPLILIVSLVLCTGLNLLWDCCGPKRDHPSEGGEYRNARQPAAIGGHEQVVKLLLDKGANVNAQVDVDSKDKDRQTPLSLAAENGHKAVVKPLLETGKVDVDLKDKDG